MRSFFCNCNIAVILVAITPLAPALADAASDLPEIMRVPAGNYVAWRTSGQGLITYECRLSYLSGPKLSWVVAGADATLGDSKEAGMYTSPPESWQSNDGSSVTGLDVVRARVGTERLYDQLVIANPASGAGLLSGVTYIQRIISDGGATPARPCNKSSIGEKMTSPYHAEFVFWKPN